MPVVEPDRDANPADHPASRRPVLESINAMLRDDPDVLLLAKHGGLPSRTGNRSEMQHGPSLFPTIDDVLDLSDSYWPVLASEVVHGRVGIEPTFYASASEQPHRKIDPRLPTFRPRFMRLSERQKVVEAELKRELLVEAQLEDLRRWHWLQRRPA